MLLRAPFNLTLDASSDEAPTTSLGNLCQCFTILAMESLSSKRWRLGRHQVSHTLVLLRLFPKSSPTDTPRNSTLGYISLGTGSASPMLPSKSTKMSPITSFKHLYGLTHFWGSVKSIIFLSSFPKHFIILSELHIFKKLIALFIAQASLSAPLRFRNMILT